MPLREAIAKYISETRNISVKPEHVVVTPGAKPIIFHGILACVDPGDEVIYPNPGFPIYESMINFVGAKPVPLPLVEEKNFSFDVQQLWFLVTEKTKMIIINPPQNPTGGVLSKEDLEAVAELAIEHDLWVILRRDLTLPLSSMESSAALQPSLGCRSGQSLSMVFPKLMP